MAMKDASGGTEAEAWLCRWNIARFRDQLAVTADEARRATLTKLLTEAEEKLRGLLSAAKDSKSGLKAEHAAGATVLSQLVPPLKEG